MVRGLVLIGVKKTGTLPELQAVDDCIEKMLAWAASQSIDGKCLKVLRDSEGEVRAHQVADAIDEIIALGTVEQLIVYFAGHGIHNKGDYWLLSRAPTNPSEAVNVSGSKYFADYCGVPHVIMISDACRTAPAGIQAQGVTGQEIFPNDPTTDGKMGVVDLFYACRRGKPSLEIADPNESKKLFTALYTDVLVSCLNGQEPEVLVHDLQGGVDTGLAKTQKVADYLAVAVPRALRARLGNSFNTNLEPDAAVLSKDAWISRVVPFPALTSTSEVSTQRGLLDKLLERALGDAADTALRSLPELGRDGVDGGPPTAGPDVTAPGYATVDPASRSTSSYTVGAPPVIFDTNYGANSVSRALLRRALGMGNTIEEQVATSSNDLADELSSTADKLKAQFGPDKFESECGIKVRGKHVRHILARNGVDVDVSIGHDGALVRVHAMNDVVSTLFVFDDGTSALIPAIPKYLGALSFVNQDLIDVTYEPVSTSQLWIDFQAKASDLRELRAVVSAANEAGVLRMDAPMLDVLLEKIRYFRTLDPSLGIYASYALHDLGRHMEVTHIQSLLDGWIGMRFFDVEMLSVQRGRRRVSDTLQVLPMCPMLSRGWPLLRALRVPDAERLLGLQRYVTNSPWTLFDARGTEQLLQDFNH